MAGTRARRPPARSVREAWVDQWIHLVPEAVRHLDELAYKAERSRHEMMREVVREYLDRLERSEVAPPKSYRGDMSAGRYKTVVPIPRRDVERAERLAREFRVSKAAIYREAVRAYLAAQGVAMEP